MKTEVLLLDNPGRRRRRRKMSALQAKYFGGKRRRRSNPKRVTASAPVSHRRRSARYSVHHVVRRRNPSGGALARAMEVVKDALAGTVGIQVNNLVGNSLAEKVLGVTGTKRSGVKVATAVILPVLASIFSPAHTRLLCAAGSAAIALEASKALNVHVYPSLGNFGNLLSTSDEILPAGYIAPASAAPRPFGYNSVTQYRSPLVYAERPPLLGAYVREVAGGMGRRDQVGVYDDGPGVY